jgi:hypothetical protein
MMHASTVVDMREEAVMIYMFLDQARAVAKERQAEASRRRLARGVTLPLAASGCCFES